jgi:hypothetical protein
VIGLRENVPGEFECSSPKQKGFIMKTLIVIFLVLLFSTTSSALVPMVEKSLKEGGFVQKDENTWICKSEKFGILEILKIKERRLLYSCLIVEVKLIINVVTDGSKIDKQEVFERSIPMFIKMCRKKVLDVLREKKGASDALLVR